MMKNQSSDLQWEVSELLEEVTVEEAHGAILRRFNQALETLDPQGQEILVEYFYGSTFETLGKRYSLSTSEAEILICKLKRQLLSQLQRNTQARH